LEGVDIISMSMVVKEEREGLEELGRLVSDAINAKRLVFIGSTEDQGSNIQTSTFPGSCKDTISIAACDSFGILLHSQDNRGDERADFYFQGDRVTVKYPLGHESEISGSSVATAVASGVAALILALSRYDPEIDMDISPDKMVRSVFTKMANGGKFVQPHTFFTPEAKFTKSRSSDEWDNEILLQWIARNFRYNS
jgi:hypothetical protein